ncbi:MAG: MMPL family transporter, partial [Verrucomicrobiota bacterium]
MKPLSVFRFSVLLAALILIYGIYSLFHLPLQTDLFSLFPQKLESLQQLKSLQKKNISTQDVFVVIPEKGEWTDAQIDSFKTAFRKSIALTENLREVQGISMNPSEMARPMAVALASLPPQDFERFAHLFQKEALQQRIQRTHQQWQGVIDEQSLFLHTFDPLGFLMESGLAPTLQKLQSTPTSRWMRIQSSTPARSFEESQALEKELRNQVNLSLQKIDLPVATHPIWLTGEAIFTAEISNSMQRDISIMLVFTIVLVIALFAFIYRSLMPLIWIFAVQTLVIFSAIIVAKLFLDGLNVITIGFASILIGVSLDYCILVYHHFSSGGNDEDETWRVMSKGIWFSAFSTGGAFGVLYFSSFPGLQQMAILVATGLITSAGFSTTLLSAALKRWRPKSCEHLNHYPHRWGEWLQKYHRSVLVVILVSLSLTTVYLVIPNFSKLYDDDVTKLQPNSLEAYQAHEQLKTWGSKFSSQGDPQESNRTLWNPETRPLLEQLWKTQDTSLGHTLTLELTSILDQWSQHKIELYAGSPGDREWKALRQELDQTAVRDFKKLSIVMLLLMALLIWSAHRSIKLSLLNLSALIVGLLVFVGLLAALEIPLTLVSLICVPLLIGLIIDYTMHFLLGFEHEGGDLPRAFHHLLIPIGTTGLTSIIGFTAPALSTQPALLNFGWVMDLGVLSAMVAVLFFLPAIAAFFQKKNNVHYSKSLYCCRIFEVATFLAAHIPRSLLRKLARLGTFFYVLLNPSRRKLVEANLKLLGTCPLEKPSAWKLYGNFATMLVDYFYFGLRTPKQQLSIIRNRIGFEHLQEIHSKGQGAFLLTSHLSFFELGGMLLNALNFKATALSMPEPTTDLTIWRTEFRRRWGIETIEVGTSAFSTFSILEALRRNE